MTATLRVEDVFAPFTWVELEADTGYRLKAVIPSSEVTAYVAKNAEIGYTFSDMEEMPKGWTPETGYDNVDLAAHHERVNAFYAQREAS